MMTLEGLETGCEAWLTGAAWITGLGLSGLHPFFPTHFPVPRLPESEQLSSTWELATPLKGWRAKQIFSPLG